ncbi:MAG: DnaJ domain-containing protein [Acidobacteriota bacterium]
MSAHFTDDPYKTLGVESNATEAEIKQAYFALVRAHPPESDPQGFKRIRAAYEKLRSRGERAETDLFRVDDSITLDADSLKRFSGEPPRVSLDVIKSDILAIEIFLLLEELKSSPSE